MPVTFDWEGKEVKGVLSWTFGTGGYHWDLKVNNYYWGMLLYRNEYEWHFFNQSDNKQHLAPYFADVLQAWYE